MTVCLDDHRRPDGTLDHDSLRAAELAAGERCAHCDQWIPPADRSPREQAPRPAPVRPTITQVDELRAAIEYVLVKGIIDPRSKQRLELAIRSRSPPPPERVDEPPETELHVFVPPPPPDPDVETHVFLPPATDNRSETRKWVDGIRSQSAELRGECRPDSVESGRQTEQPAVDGRQTPEPDPVREFDMFAYAERKGRSAKRK